MISITVPSGARTWHHAASCGALDLGDHLQAARLQSRARGVHVVDAQADHRAGREEGVVRIGVGIDVELGVGAEPEPGRSGRLPNGLEADVIAEEGDHLVEPIRSEADEADARPRRSGGSERSEVADSRAVLRPSWPSHAGEEVERRGDPAVRAGHADPHRAAAAVPRRSPPPPERRRDARAATRTSGRRSSRRRGRAGGPDEDARPGPTLVRRLHRSPTRRTSGPSRRADRRPALAARRSRLAGSRRRNDVEICRRDVGSAAAPSPPRSRPTR